MDKVIVCQDCGKEFSFSENEQEFYKNLGFPEPKRCKFCRTARKNKNFVKNNHKNVKKF